MFTVLFLYFLGLLPRKRAAETQCDEQQRQNDAQKRIGEIMHGVDPENAGAVDAAGVPRNKRRGDRTAAEQRALRSTRDMPRRSYSSAYI